MNKSQATTVLDDLTARVEEQDVEMHEVRKVLDLGLIPCTQLQAEVDVLHGHGRGDAPLPNELPLQPSNGAIAPFLNQQRLRTFDGQGCM